MLVYLRVRDLAIIDDLTLELGPGLQVLTGETGAGKSILVAALELVVGARGRAELVRTGAEEAIVEALFDLTDHPDARAQLKEATGLDDQELVVQRVVRANGRSRATLNGRLATAMQVQQVVAGLVDICSQHEHHSLTDPAVHLSYLDDFASLGPSRAAMAATWGAWREAVAAVDELAHKVRARVEREVVLRFHLEELDLAAPRAGELEDLEEEGRRLAHADRLSKGTRRAEVVLYGGDDAVVDRVARALADLSAMVSVDPRLAPLVERLEELQAGLEDVGRELGRYARGVVADPTRLLQVDERVATLRRLVRKHGGSFEDLLVRHAGLREELTALDDVEHRLEELEAARQRSADAAVVQARALSASRRDAARALGSAITEQLASLGMGGARIEVDVARLDARTGGLDAEGATVSATGMDRVEFLIAPNRGEAPRPLRRIASGGELSRALLAVKRVLASTGPRALYVFDEVDTGVGGGVAEAIGRKLHEVSRAHQVLCITHLPQIAVYADRHLHVSKATRQDRTTSVVHLLEGGERLEEVARMMGGIEITDATRGAAAALLEQATRARES